MNSAPHARSGVAGGMLSAARLLGQTLGAPVSPFCFAPAAPQAQTSR